MINVRQAYYAYCNSKLINFDGNTTVKANDDSTLFCCSGMQQHKNKFSDINLVDTFANIQPCIRLNDLDEIGDGTHLLTFNMMGLFSFRQLSVKQAVDFWYGFLNYIGLKPDYVTIHPDKISEWSYYYNEYNVEIRPDSECTWSDGEIGGYCTEFYINNIEVGNIVNPLGTCIDVGFGLERLELVLGKQSDSVVETLTKAILAILEAGYKPGPKKHEYVLRKLMRLLHRKGGMITNELFTKEVEQLNKAKVRYARLKPLNMNKSKEWWLDTHGIYEDEM